MILSLRDAGKSLNVSHVMITKYIASGTLIKDEKINKIDTDNPVNNVFFRSKGCSFPKTTEEEYQKYTNPPQTSKKKLKTDNKTTKKVKKEPEQSKINQKPKIVEKAEKKTTPQQTRGKATLDFDDPIFKIEIQTKLANLKVKEADYKLKTLKTEEARGKLISSDLVEELVFNTLSNIIQSYSTKPYSYIDKLVSMIDEGQTKESIVKMLAEEYTNETKKIIETAKSKFERKKKEIIKGLRELNGEDTGSN